MPSPKFQAGSYYMRDVVCGLGEASNARKTPYLYLAGKITHRSEGGQWVPCGDSERTVYLYLSEGAFPYTVEKLDRLGFNGDFENPSLSGIADGVGVECVHEDYQGSPHEKWELPSDGAKTREHATPTSDSVRRLNALYANHKRNDSAPPPPPLAVEEPYRPVHPADAGTVRTEGVPF